MSNFLYDLVDEGGKEVASMVDEFLDTAFRAIFDPFNSSSSSDSSADGNSSGGGGCHCDCDSHK